MGLSLPFKLPKLEVRGVKSREPEIATTMSFKRLLGLPPPAVLSIEKAFPLLEPTSTLPKFVKLEVLVIIEPLGITIPLPLTSRVP